MRGFHNLDSHGLEVHRRVVLDAAHAARLSALATSNLYGGTRLARLLRQERGDIAIVPSAEMPAGVVNFGSEVIYRDEAVGEDYTIVLAMPHEADIHARRVSVLSPVGTALIGRSVGDVVACEFPAGQMRRLSVLRVLPDPPMRPDAAAQRRLTRTRQASAPDARA